MDRQNWGPDRDTDTRSLRGEGVFGARRTSAREAGASHQRLSSLQGDSGGPLLCGGAFSGLVSGGRKCGDATKPGVYTLLTPALQAWIRSKLRPPPAE